jgi:hypothetical protein
VQILPRESRELENTVNYRVQQRPRAEDLLLQGCNRDECRVPRLPFSRTPCLRAFSDGTRPLLPRRRNGPHTMERAVIERMSPAWLSQID